MLDISETFVHDKRIWGLFSTTQAAKHAEESEALTAFFLTRSILYTYKEISSAKTRVITEIPLVQRHLAPGFQCIDFSLLTEGVLCFPLVGLLYSF